MAEEETSISAVVADAVSTSVPSTSAAVIQDPLMQGPSPFVDPVQRTKYLIQYIRIRKQRAENEIAKRDALRKQKKDAKATLQNAKDGLKGNEEEVRRCELRLEELNRMRHELCSSYKAVINKETERKRQREAAEEARRNEEQQRFQQQQQQQNFTTAAQLLGVDPMLIQQLKNAQLLNAFSANPGLNNRVVQLISSSTNSNVNGATNSAGNPSTSVPTATISPAPTNTNSSSQSNFTPLQQQQLAAAAVEASLQQQRQQQQNATAALNFLRQQYALNSTTQSQPQPPTVSSTIRQLQQQQQQLLNAGNNGNGASTLSFLQQAAQQQQQPSQATVLNTAALQQAIAGAGISQETMYHAILANLTGGVPKND